MPYIDARSRNQVEISGPTTCGELNYVLTQAICFYVERKGLKYQTINDVVGALEGAKAEFYRRVAAPYEDAKIKENGDAYPETILPRRPDDGHS